MNDFDAYQQWLGIPPDRRPPNHYELLGLDLGDDDADRIRAASLQRSVTVRRYCLGQHGAEATRLLGEIAAAFACLSDPAAKAAYDRQLTGDDGDESDADAPPPVQRLLEWSDDDARDYNAQAGGPQTFVAPRASLSLGRRRGTSPAGPGRFSLAACLLLAAACGGVWSARYRPHADARPQSAAGQKSVASARGVEPLGPPWADLARKSPAPQSPRPLAPEEAPSTAGAKNGSSERPESAVKGNEESDPAAALPPEDVPQDQSPADAEMNAAAAADREFNDKQVRQLQPPAKPDETQAGGAESTTPADAASSKESAASPSVPLQPGVLLKAAAAPFSVAQVTGKEDMHYQNMAEDFGKAWRSEPRGKPEVLELTFEKPVRPRYLRVFDTPLPADIDEEQVVLYPVNGPPQSVRPAKVNVGAANRRARTWSLGRNRPPIDRIKITFLPTVEGFVEVDAVALLDEEQNLYYAVAARATSSCAEDDPDLLGTERPSVAQTDQTGDSHKESRDSLDKVDEVIAVAQLDEARKLQTVGAYAALLKEHPNTAAAVEAVRDLADLVATARPGEANLVWRAIDRLVAKYPDSEAAKEAEAIIEANLPLLPGISSSRGE